MPNNPVRFNDPYQLPASAASVIPPELGQDFLTSLDQTLQQQEKRATENILGNMESRGILQSGITTRDVVEQVLGPGIQRRQQALLPLAFQGAQIGQSQRFQKEQQHQDLLDRLQYLQEQAKIQQQLMFYQNELANAGLPNSRNRDLGEMFGEQFVENVGSNLGKFLGGGFLSGEGPSAKRMGVPGALKGLMG